MSISGKSIREVLQKNKRPEIRAVMHEGGGSSAGGGSRPVEGEYGLILLKGRMKMELDLGIEDLRGTDPVSRLDSTNIVFLTENWIPDEEKHVTVKFTFVRFFLDNDFFLENGAPPLFLAVFEHVPQTGTPRDMSKDRTSRRILFLGRWSGW